MASKKRIRRMCSKCGVALSGPKAFSLQVTVDEDGKIVPNPVYCEECVEGEKGSDPQTPPSQSSSTISSTTPAIGVEPTSLTERGTDQSAVNPPLGPIHGDGEQPPETYVSGDASPETYVEMSKMLKSPTSTVEWLPPASKQTSSVLSNLLKSEVSIPNGQPSHVEVRALAGTGKTTTIIQGLCRDRGIPTKITPSPQQEEVWKQMSLGKRDSVRLCAFNTTITDEMKARLAESGLDKRGVEARGIHSLGNYAVSKAFGKMEAIGGLVDKGKPSAICEHLMELLGDANYWTLRAKPGMATTMKATEQLVSLCKQTLTDPTTEGLDQLTSRYDVELETSKQRVYELVPQILERCKAPKGKISFDDMVWLPVVMGLPVYKTDVVVVDESQDLNRMQQELVYKAGHRIIFVGDRKQAIYGFSGADAASMDRMGQKCEGTPQGLTSIPLTVTRRCGKAIVEEAKKIVPEYEAHESNCEGLVRHALYPLIPKERYSGYIKPSRERLWEETYCPLVQPGAMVLCRVNAPLVSQCFRFLKRNIPAVILGRKIGEGLVALVEKANANSTVDLRKWLQGWLETAQAEEQSKKFPSEEKLIGLQDKFDCLDTFMEDTLFPQEVVAKINKTFSDTKDTQVIRFSSVHKSKGLEARQVFILQPDGAQMPHPSAKSRWQIEQEYNLLYVAITRTIEELTFVS